MILKKDKKVERFLILEKISLVFLISIIFIASGIGILGFILTETRIFDLNINFPYLFIFHIIIFIIFAIIHTFRIRKCPKCNQKMIKSYPEGVNKSVQYECLKCDFKIDTSMKFIDDLSD